MKRPLSHQASWVAGANRVWRDISGHYRPRANDRSMPDRNAGQDNRVCSNPNVVLNQDGSLGEIEWRIPHVFSSFGCVVGGDQGTELSDLAVAANLNISPDGSKIAVLIDCRSFTD